VSVSSVVPKIGGPSTFLLAQRPNCDDRRDVFARIKRSRHNGKDYEYVQIVESFRDGTKVRQRVVANLGRYDRLISDGSLDGLLQSLARFSQRLRVVEKVRSDGLEAHATRSWGAALVFGRLWEQQGLPESIAKLSRERGFGFSLERACFALALQRLCMPGSDLQGAAWVKTVECPGFETLELQHLYRTVAWLATVKEPLEKDLFLRDRDLFSQKLDLLFIDTTSTYLYSNEQTELRRHGYSRDKRPDLRQVVLCVAVDQRGWPVAWDILPGNTADKSAFLPMIEKLRTRFQIGRAIVVADRGMISKGTIELLEGDQSAPLDFILGCRMRQQKEVNVEVLSRAGRYKTVAPNLDVKEVVVDGNRYIVCRNPIQARKDAAARQDMVARLEQTLSNGPKSMLKNRGYARFLRVQKGAMSIDRDALERDARLDGKFVLRTSTKLSTDEVAQAYKSLWRVERTFRKTKSTLEVRPVFHRRDDTTIGHILGCFLALRLEVDLQQRLDVNKVEAPWASLVRDLDEVKAIEVTLDGERYHLRSELRGHAGAAFQAAGVRPPPTLHHAG